MAKTLRAIAMQTKIELESYRNRASFEAFLTAEMERAKPQLSEEYPSLVVFPEDIGTPLVTMGSFNAVKDSRTLDEAVAAISKRSMDYVLVSRIRHRAGGTPAVFLSKEPIIRKAYEEVFSSLAQEYNAYILAGTVVLPPERHGPTPAATDPLEVLKNVREATKKTKLYNTAYLFGPNGDILLRQRKVNLIPLEKEEGLGLYAGDIAGLQPYTIEGIPIGVTICYDAFFPEVVRSLEDNGARILVDPSANPEPWTKETEDENRKGLYARVQEETGIEYGIQAMLTGRIFNLTFEGRSSIVTKKDNTPDLSGIMCQANNHYEPGVIAADLSV
jgi:predicted amidohydrolase